MEEKDRKEYFSMIAWSEKGYVVEYTPFFKVAMEKYKSAVERFNKDYKWHAGIVRISYEEEVIKNKIEHVNVERQDVISSGTYIYFFNQSEKDADAAIEKIFKKDGENDGCKQ